MEKLLKNGKLLKSKCVRRACYCVIIDDQKFRVANACTCVGQRLQSKIDDHHLCTSEGSAKMLRKTQLLVSGAVRCSRLAAKQLSWRLTVGLISWSLAALSGTREIT